MLPGLGAAAGLGGARASQLPARQRDPAQRRGDLQNRLASRDQVSDRMQRRDDIRSDWQDRHDAWHDRHGDWHHDYWHDHGGWWNHMWEDHTALMAFGTTMWGLNAAAYGFGYWDYSNPYYTESYPIGADTVIDYSQPLQPDAMPVAEASQPSMSDFDAARQAFYQGDYVAALKNTDAALATMPNDPIIHEFRALVLFAQGRYPEAAAGLYGVLSAGPGWDWTTLASLYPNVDVYTQQLRALEAAVRSRPNVAAPRFVLAYQYMCTGNKQAAARELKSVQTLQPNDKLVKELLVMTGGQAPATESTSGPAKSTAPTVAVHDLEGTWNATGQANTKFALKLAKDGNFSWTYTEGVKAQTVKGVYALDKNVLALEPETGGTMLAEVTQPRNNQFAFSMLGAPPGDAGLKFARTE